MKSIKFMLLIITNVNHMLKRINIWKESKKENTMSSSFFILPCSNLHRWYYCTVIIGSPTRFEVKDCSKRKERLVSVNPVTNWVRFTRKEASQLLIFPFLFLWRNLASPYYCLVFTNCKWRCGQVRSASWKLSCDWPWHLLRDWPWRFQPL